MAVVPLVVSYTYTHNNKEKSKDEFKHTYSLYTCEFMSSGFKVTAKGSAYMNYVIIYMANVTRFRD